MPFTPANLDLARETIARYPVKKSAVLPLLHLVQDQDGDSGGDCGFEQGQRGGRGGGDSG